MLTEEQQEVVDAVMSSNDDRIIAVNAIAGSGKTRTANGIVEAYNPKNGFYTAFNRAIIKDSSKRFGDKLDCRTIHSLAYKYVQPKSVQELSYKDIKEDLSYPDKEALITILDDFYRSASINLEEWLDVQGVKSLKPLIIEYANKMLDRHIPITFNFMLKYLHLMLVEGNVEIENDLVILDECQDTTAVTLEIFKHINAKRKVILGDRFQNIYSFMKTVNAFEELPNLNTFRLTKSFRCIPEVADRVESFGNSYLMEYFKYKGNEDLDTETHTAAYISRTNSTLIKRMYDLLNLDKTFSLTRSIDEIFELPLALINANSGNKVYSKKYKFLEDEYGKWKDIEPPKHNFFEYIGDVTNNPIIDNASRIVLDFVHRGVNLYGLKEKVKAMKPNKYLILTTAHAFKGLEADTVYIENDLNNRIAKLDTKYAKYAMPTPIITLRKYMNKDEIEELNTYYVALSRARFKLHNACY